MKIRIALLLTTSLVALPSVQAQDVTLRGKVEDVSGTTNQFVVDCTDTALTSTAFNLNAWVGQQVELTGAWNGSFTSPAIDVTAIAAIVEGFEIGGGAKIGENINFGVTGAPGLTAVAFASPASGFLPLAPFGTLLIDPLNMVVAGAGTIPGVGVVQFGATLPNNPNLVGVDLFGQGAILNFSTGEVTLTNPDCKTIDQ